MSHPSLRGLEVLPRKRMLLQLELSGAAVPTSRLTSVGTQKGVIGDGTRLGKGVEFIEPLSRDVELQ